MALISKNTPFRTLNERRFSYLLKRSQLKQVASSGRYTLKQKTRGVSGEDSPLERCGLRTGERIVLGEDNIPTEEQRRGETLARSARGGSPSLSALRMSSDQSEQGRSQLLPPRLRLLFSLAQLLSPLSPHTNSAHDLLSRSSLLSPRPGQTLRPRSRRTPTKSVRVLKG